MRAQSNNSKNKNITTKIYNGVFRCQNYQVLIIFKKNSAYSNYRNERFENICREENHKSDIVHLKKVQVKLMKLKTKQVWQHCRHN